MKVELDEFNKAKYLQWKYSLFFGVEKIIDGIEKESKRLLGERMNEEEEKERLIVERSWYHSDVGLDRHVFGYDSPVASDVEDGKQYEGVEEKGVGEAGERWGTSESRPFLKPAIKSFVGSLSNQILIKSIEPLNENIEEG